MRPNIMLQHDLDFVEDVFQKEYEELEHFMRLNKRRQFTILEIGCSCVQPLARKLAMERWLNDKYKCTLIRINPLHERPELYQEEEDALEAICT